jgi:hypothetical protein
MTTTRVYDEIIDFITMAPLPQDIIAFKPSPKLVARVEILLDKKREDKLTESDKSELERYMIYEHIMRMAKARARQRLAAK